MARRATAGVGGLPVLRKHQHILARATEGDGHGFGKLRAPVLLVAEGHRRRSKPARGAAGRVHGEDGGAGVGVAVVGPAGGDTVARGGGRLRDALRVELVPREPVARCAHARVADPRGAALPGVPACEGGRRGPRAHVGPDEQRQPRR